MKLIFALNIERRGVEAESTVQLSCILCSLKHRVRKREDGRERICEGICYNFALEGQQ